MSKPVVAIVGRPNVGKSTLFNVLAGETISIVKDTPGVTRDRIYADCTWLNMNFTLIDTGGIEPDTSDVILSQMREQAEIAIATADVIVFIVDVRQGLVDADTKVADMLRKSRKPVVLAVNKVDSYEKFGNDVYEFYNLGIGDLVPVSAASRLGIGDLLDEVVKYFDCAKLEEEEDERPRIAVVGKPNVGKSSLLNTMIGQKVAIVSSKPQTTRTKIMGVLTKGKNQLVFLDTPGLHKPHNALGNYMVKSITDSVAGVDACLLVVEAGKPVSAADRDLIEKFKSSKLPALLAINKIDCISDKSILMEQIISYTELFDFEAIVPVSATTGSSVNDLIGELEKLCQPGGHFFAEDALTDQPERVLAGEIIREKLLRLLDKEIPHGVAVVVERMRERENQPDMVDIDAVIYCERDNHKGIIIGKKGSMLKRVGSYAREDMERFFDCKINLQLWVKVKEDWRNRQRILQSLGYGKTDFE